MSISVACLRRIMTMVPAFSMSTASWKLPGIIIMTLHTVTGPHTSLSKHDWAAFSGYEQTTGGFFVETKSARQNQAKQITWLYLVKWRVAKAGSTKMRPLGIPWESLQAAPARHYRNSAAKVLDNASPSMHESIHLEPTSPRRLSLIHI